MVGDFKFGDRTAFPCGEETTSGLSYRQYFAGQAFQAILSRTDAPLNASTYDEYAEIAVQAADALLLALKP